MPIIPKRKRTPEECAAFATEMAQAGRTPMAKYYISFGTSPGQRHTIGAVTTDHDHLYEIEAADSEDARFRTEGLFGSRWAALRTAREAQRALNRRDCFKGIIKLDRETIPCG